MAGDTPYLCEGFNLLKSYIPTFLIQRLETFMYFVKNNKLFNI